MFARKPPQDKLQDNQPAAPGVIFDAGTDDFEQKVMLASMEVPVLADFWAPWCGPCKQLTPLLEAAVKAAGGKVLLAKINIDDHPALAQALRVQSVPTVFAFFQGRPVTAFTGARPQSEIKAFIDQLVKMAQGAQPDAIDIPAALAQAAQFLAEGKHTEAQEIYSAVLTQDENNAQAYTGMVRAFIAAGHVDEAKELVDHAPEAIAKDPNFAAARTALELAKDLPQGDEAAFRRALEKNPADHQARFDLALTLFARGRRGEAIDELIAIIRRDRKWDDEKARQQLLKFFDALGPADPDTVAGRRKLSSVLFS